MFLLLFVLALTILFFYNFYWKRRNLPPGPTPLPVLGNLHTFVRLAPGYQAFEQWTKQYGPVFTFWMSENPIVVVSEFEIMKDTFVRDGEAYAGRDLLENLFESMTYMKGNYGILRGQGEEWLQLRRFSIKLLRTLGMGRNVMEEKIMLEVNTIISTVNDHLSSSTDKTKGYNLSELTDVAAGSIINQLTFGFRFIGGLRENFFELRKVMGQLFEDFMHPAVIMIVTFPWLRHFPIFSYFFKRIQENDVKMNDFFSKNINDTIERQAKEKQAGIIRDEEDTYFIEAFLHEMQQRNSAGEINAKDKIFTMKALKGLCVDLFIAGQDTTSNTLRFLLLYMMLFPETQAKMQQELDEVLGDNENGKKRVTVSERTNLPYTNALINESQRLCNLVPLNLLHRTTRDVVCGGYKIAKGTRIVPMISTVLYDQKVFPEPDKFMPERFIENGQLKKCEEFIPFSLGKRQCVGESLAKMELFLFTANFFYLFKIRTVDPNNPPSLEKKAGLTVVPVDYKCIIEKRKQNLL